MIGHVLTVEVIGLVQKMVASAPFPFPLFRAFLPPPPPPLFAPATQARGTGHLISFFPHGETERE